MSSRHARKLTLLAIKWLISLAIVGYLVWRATGEGTFDSLLVKSRNWWALTAAFALSLTGLLLAATRWWMLVRCQHFTFRWRDAVRLSMMGYVINFLSLGVAGEDLFKAFFLASQHGKGRRTEAFSTVLADRVVGIYSLFLLAATGVLIEGTWRAEAGPTVAYISRAALVALALGTLVILCLLSPLLTNHRLADQLRRLPWIGPALHNLVLAVMKFRDRPGVLLAALGFGLTIHLSVAAIIYLVALGLRIDPPPPLAHLVIVPLSFLVQMIPLPMGALGALEFAFSYLYKQIGHCPEGLIVILGVRAVTLLTLIVSAIAYATRSPAADEALHEAEEATEAL